MTLRILFNGRIYANFTSQGTYSAIALDDHGVLALGNDREIIDQYPTADRKINLNGHTIFPGLIDSHIHITKYGASLAKVNCETKNKMDCLLKLRVAAETVKPGDWILGYGWNHNIWPEGIGNRHELDKISDRNPIYLTSKSLHSAWVNSKALEHAHITKNTPDPPGGKIVRDNQGNPTGILLESAVKLIDDQVPSLSIEQTEEVITLAQNPLHQMGVTGIHDFDPVESFIALQNLDVSNQLYLRTTKFHLLELLDHVSRCGLRSGFGNKKLRFGGIKIFTDGALGPQTAAMLSPYEGDPDNFGVLLEDQESIYGIGQKAVTAGLSLAIHAIGDKANHEAIQALTNLNDSFRDNFRLRHRIEHVQVIHPDDLPALKNSNVIASMQPLHAISDMEMAIEHWGERTQYAYAWNTVSANVASEYHLAFGSDAPVDLPNPFLGIASAVNRISTDSHSEKITMSPGEKVNLKLALKAYTQGAAYAGYFENEIGQLKPGFQADLIVLESDPFQLPPEELGQIKPIATLFNNQWVWIDPETTSINLY